ncbi:MAG: cellulase family glycosylhydrolase [Bacteroidales bacterium]|nr:cellulase family glycosylhydrolase [Bacteroidales bacterium]
MKIISLLAVYPVFLYVCLTSSFSQAFVKAEGKRFVMDNESYYFAGVNMWYACYLGATPEGRIRLVHELDTLRSLGITNIRIAGGTEKSALTHALKKALQQSPGVYDTTLLKGLDFALAEMGKRGMKAVVFLTNFWPWSGGMAQYVNWVTGDSIPDPDITNDWRDWQKFMDFSASFYTNDSANVLFRNHINMLVNRVNKFTDCRYKDDAVIMAWELANEPRPCPDVPIKEVNIPAFISWAHQTAAYIHSIDSNHLVTTGTEGKVGCRQDTAVFLQLHESPFIDYANFHLWPRNWQWFDCTHMDQTLESSKQKAIEYVNLHISLAEKLGKPVTLEEFGLERDSCLAAPGTPVNARDSYLKTLFDKVYQNAANGGPLVGTNIWAWGGFGKPFPRAQVLDYADALLGDPLEEMQGLNSVYATDTSTLFILRNHAEKMNSLSGR